MDIRKWLFYNGSKDHAWIVYQNLEQITTDSKYHGLCNPLKNRDQIQYIHAIEMDLDNLTCLLETADGFYLIRNEKKTIEVVEESEVKLNNVSLGGTSAQTGNTDMGSRVSVVSGQEVRNDGQPGRLILMKIRQEWWEEDQLELLNRTRQIDEEIRRKKTGEYYGGGQVEVNSSTF